jgi:hypothetical protein
MSRLRVALAIGLAGSLGGCDLPGSGADALDVLKEARAKARAAPYLTVVGHGQSTQFAPGLTVISRHGTILVWETKNVSYIRSKQRDCYMRSTEFERADDVEIRRDAVVADAFLHKAQLVGSEIRWQGPDAEEGYRVEGIVYLDRAGRPVRVRERTAQLNGEHRDPWSERRYSYPSSLDIKHPGPVCPS